MGLLIGFNKTKCNVLFLQEYLVLKTENLIKNNEVYQGLKLNKGPISSLYLLLLRFQFLD